MIDICLTFDIEFSIAGTFIDPEMNKPLGKQNVYCNIDGKSHGLGFILETLDEYETSATFFIEVLNINYFGLEPMKQIAHEIKNAGHDVELHIHPCWSYFSDPDWSKKLTGDPPCDALTDRPMDEVVNIIKESLQFFEKMKLPEPKILRTGGLKTDRQIYEAMHKLGIPYASNIGVAIYPPADEDLILYSGCHEVNHILEFPVVTYSRFNFGRYAADNLFTITGTSIRESKEIIRLARKSMISPVVILSHPHEFVKTKDYKLSNLRKNDLNQKRLIKLLEFLNINRHKFRTLTLLEAAESVQKRGSSDNLKPALSFLSSIDGIYKNVINDYILKE